MKSSFVTYCIFLSFNYAALQHNEEMHQVILEIICSIRRLERQSHRSTLAQRESSIELGLFDGSLGARVSGQQLSSMGFHQKNQLGLGGPWPFSQGPLKVYCRYAMN